MLWRRPWRRTGWVCQVCKVCACRSISARRMEPISGTIDYGGGELGYLVYVKLSLTGNEPDYVKQYQREHPAFPHQTTADQLFNEEQFEAYRALGGHAAEDLSART